MKKILLFASALAGLFLAASCQQESLEPVGGNTVTYTVQVPGALSTKAIGTDVSKVTELIYEVYRIDENDVETRLYQKKTSLTNGSATVELELVNNQDFRVLFWAQVPENGVYTTTSLKNVTLATGLNANAENYAAFAGQDEITDGENLTGRTVTLVRPVAQLNIATSAESLVIGEGGIDPTTVTFKETAVKVEGLSTVYNVADGAAGADEATFTYAAKPVALSETTLNVNGVDYSYVAMNYVGFAQTSGDNVKVTYTIETNEVGTITNTISNVPVKANHRTNIIGNLITSTSDYTVTLSATWPTDEENVQVVAVSTAAGLQEAIDDIPAGTEGNIKLEGDIDLGALAGMISTKAGENPYGLLIPAGKTIILDLNGCTLKQEVECKASYSMIKNQGNLTITGNGTISFNDLSAGGGSEWGSYIIDNTGYLTVENGTIVHLGSTNFTDRPTNLPIQNYAGKVVINGGIISSPSFRSLRDFTAGGEIIINGGQFLGQVWMQGLGAGSSSLTINGGEFNPTAGYDGSSVYITNGTNDVQVSITGGTFNTKIGCSDAAKAGVKGSIVGGIFTAAAKENTKAELLADGYFFEADGDNFKVTSNDVAKVGETTYKSLAAAIDAVEDGGTVTLIADEVFTEYNRVNNGGEWYEGLLYDGDKSFTLDLGGKTLSQNGAVNDYLLYFKNNGEKANTITIQNGTIDAGTNAYAALATASSNAQKITMNLENISINGNNSGGAVVKFRGGGELNVKAGTVITGKDNYCGIEVYGTETIANIYEGVKIYQNGTTSYVGAIAGVSGNATMNVYGGKGVSAKCGLIVMSSGGTINVEGGEWTANTDGTPKNDNFGVLVSQFDNATYPTAVTSVINVAGGTFRGGYNCYGNVADKAFIHISGGNFNADPTGYLVAGYEITEENGLYTVGIPKSQIAFEAAIAEGGTVTLEKDVTLVSTVTVAEGNEVVLDLNGKTITGTMHKSVGAVLKNNGTLTIKNGTISSTAANGGSAVVNNGTLTVEEATLNGAPNAGGSWPSYTVNNTGVMTATKTKITSYHGALCSYGEGAEATLNDSEIDMAGIPGFTSHGIYTYSNGKVVVNGGTYANKATDQHGTGGSVINGVVEVTAGTFSGRIEAYYGTPVLKGGTYSEKPAASYVPAGYGVEANGDGTFSVGKLSPVAKIGEIEYYSLQEAFNAGGEITLLRNVKLTEMAVHEAGKTATLDLNGYNITVPDATKHIYAINNKGNLTLRDSKGTGSVRARGIYNGYNGSNTDETVEGATMTVESGNFFALDSNGGAAIFNCAKAIINGGVFDGQVAAFNGRKCAETTINGGVFRSVDNYAIQQNNGGKLTINDATVNRGFGAVGCFGGEVTIAEGEFLPTGTAGTTCHVVYVAAGADVTINGGTYKMNYPETDVPDSGTAVTNYDGAELYITGGTFYAHFDGYYPVELSSGSTITGGKYLDHSGKPVNHPFITNYVAEGYELNANGEVVEK